MTYQHPCNTVVPGYKFRVSLQFGDLGSVRIGFHLPARVDDVGPACTDTWSGNEISVGRNEFAQFPEEFTFVCCW